MKTFRQFLEDSQAPQDVADTQTIESFIDEHCKPFLEELTIPAWAYYNWPLYRGINRGGDRGKEVFLKIDGKYKICNIKTVRKDRRPLDTHPQLSTSIDDAFDEVFGWSPRSEAVFTYGKSGRNAAADYGRLQTIIPIGKFKYIWSPEVEDLTQTTQGLLHTLRIDHRSRLDKFSKEELQQFEEHMVGFVKDNYQDDDLKAAINGARREIMIDCETYLAIPE